MRKIYYIYFWNKGLTEIKFSINPCLGKECCWKVNNKLSDKLDAINRSFSNQYVGIFEKVYVRKIYYIYFYDKGLTEI